MKFCVGVEFRDLRGNRVPIDTGVLKHGWGAKAWELDTLVVHADQKKRLICIYFFKNNKLNE